MLLSPNQVAALLKTLGLAQSVYKPTPQVHHNSTLQTAASSPLALGLPLQQFGHILAEEPDNSTAGTVNITCNVEPYDPPSLPSQTFPPFNQTKANVFRYRQQQSVNLGSWFVHEQWMTPSLFTCASGPQIAEIDIASGWGNTTAARTVLERHWDTFINQSDFQYLSSIGINTVRLPIGYWSLGPLYCQGTPFEPYAEVYTNSWSRIIRAINWADEVGIGVLVDLHGAPGSQNGQPHSGISDGQVNLFNNATNIQKTKDVLLFLIQQLSSATNVIGIELLNEPNDDSSLQDFYTDAIAMMRESSPEAGSFPLYIHDAFNLQEYSGYAANRTDFVVEDHHSYFVFDSDDASRNATSDAAVVRTSVFQSLSSASNAQRRNLIAGEWSCALVDSALTNMTDPSLARQEFCQGQEQVYANTTAGWHFWSYMKEGCDSDLNWCFKSAVNKTLPSTFFSYKNGPFTSAFQMLNTSRAVFDMQSGPMADVLQNFFGVPSSSNSSGINNSTSNPTRTSSSIPQSSMSTHLHRARRSFHGHNHRFDAISAHRSVAIHEKRALPPALAGLANYTGPERSITKGYSDGFLTAKIFAQYGLSRLGFTGQYVSDSIAALGQEIVEPGTESYYTEWFNHGLADGEAVISSNLPAPDNNS